MLESEHTWLLQANDIGHIGHEDPAFQLKTRFSPDCGRRLILANNKFRLLLIRVDLFATNEDSFKEINVVLIDQRASSQQTIFKAFPKQEFAEVKQATNLSF